VNFNSFGGEKSGKWLPLQYDEVRKHTVQPELLGTLPNSLRFVLVASHTWKGVVRPGTICQFFFTYLEFR
jgi:hypothetical protein